MCHNQTDENIDGKHSISMKCSSCSSKENHFRNLDWFSKKFHEKLSMRLNRRYSMDFYQSKKKEIANLWGISQFFFSYFISLTHFLAKHSLQTNSSESYYSFPRNDNVKNNTSIIIMSVQKRHIIRLFFFFYFFCLLVCWRFSLSLWRKKILVSRTNTILWRILTVFFFFVFLIWCW